MNVISDCSDFIGSHSAGFGRYITASASKKFAVFWSPRIAQVGGVASSKLRWVVTGL